MAELTQWERLWERLDKNERALLFIVDAYGGWVPADAPEHVADSRGLLVVAGVIAPTGERNKLATRYQLTERGRQVYDRDVFLGRTKKVTNPGSATGLVRKLEF